MKLHKYILTYAKELWACPYKYLVIFQFTETERKLWISN